MRICFIGNSHLGPLAVSSQDIKAVHDADKRKFYISRTYGTQRLKVVGLNKVSILDMVKIDADSATKSTIFTEDYDQFVIVGFGFSLISIVESWREYQPDDLPAYLGGQLMTKEVAKSYNNYCLAKSQASRLLAELRAVTDKPITLVPAPLPAKWAAEESGERLETFHLFRGAEPARYVHDVFMKQQDRFRAEGIRIVSQPLETIDELIWTKSTLCLGQPGIDDPRGFFEKRDFYHMNKKFGNLMLQEVLDALY
ncbi:hypothetical protein [Glutamicibacter endophyticus]|uniref:hypothetical protein n=1 Tax=Glutamicibacter endophyticus TaxID=1522174 RepID=UPI003AEFCD91